MNKNRRGLAHPLSPTLCPKDKSISQVVESLSGDKHCPMCKTIISSNKRVCKACLDKIIREQSHE